MHVAHIGAVLAVVLLRLPMLTATDEDTQEDPSAPSLILTNSRFVVLFGAK